MKLVLSCYQAAPLLDARSHGAASASCSFDLGRTEREVRLDDLGVEVARAPAPREAGAEAPTREDSDSAGGVRISWSTIEQIAETDSVCFSVESGEASPLRIFSEAANRSFQLWPTPTSPALLISGFLMHRIRDVAPDEGAARMVRALGKVHGRLLDTTTGLGYAAIAAARIASKVVTVELEPAVRELARSNPWSRELFENPKIELCDGDSGVLVPTLDQASFSAIVHDPPAINLAGELYSARFYGALHRVLTRNGKLFHYIGDANSASGARTTRGVVKRLRDAGFSRVTVLEEAFGVLANA